MTQRPIIPDTCKVCGHQGTVSRVARRCNPCAVLVQQASNTASSARRIPIHAPEAEAAIGDAVQRRRDYYPDCQEGYVCAYSEILLEVNKTEYQRGDYVSFDHVIPTRGDRAVLCSRIVNDLKGWMTDEEFRRFVCEVMNPEAPRQIHGVDVETSREYLKALRALMKREGNEAELERLRDCLKNLSSFFHY